MKGAIALSAVVAIGLLLAGLVVPLLGTSDHDGNNTNDESGSSVGTGPVLDTPFRINGDAELDAKASASGWSGNGTPANPYIITNLNINPGTGSYSTYGIYIGNTTRSFVVQSGTIYRTTTDSSSVYSTGAVNLYHVQNAQVNSVSIPSAYTGVLLTGCKNVTMSGVSVSNANTYCVKIDSCDNVTITNSYFSSANLNNVLASNSKNLSIGQNTIVSSKGEGLRMVSSHNSSVSGNSFYNSQAAQIRLVSSNHTIIQYNSVSSYQGITVESSSFDIIRNNSMSSTYANSKGVYLLSSNNISVLGNDISYYAFGVLSTTSVDGLIGNNTVQGCYNGITMQTSSVRNVVQDNSVTNIQSIGVRILSSNDSLVRNNTCQSCQVGIYLDGSGRNAIDGNTVDLCYTGLGLTSSPDGRITGNKISHCTWSGIALSYSENNVLFENALESCSITMDGFKNAFSTQDIPVNNTVNGRPVYYYANADMDNATVPLDAGQVILANVTYVHVTGLNLSDQNAGLVMSFCSNVLVEDSTFIDNHPYGMAIYYSEDNVFRGNQLEGCYISIYMMSSNNNLFDRNTMTSSNVGLDLHYSIGTVMVANEIGNCSEAGISLAGSESSQLYDNVLVDCSVFLVGDESDHSSHIIPTNNTVNGRPVYYYANADLDNATVPLDAGQVILANVTYVHVTGLNLSDQNAGLVIGYSSYILVDENDLSQDAPNGIYVCSSQYVAVLNNRVTGSDCGVYLYESSLLRVEHNMFTGCYCGVVVAESSMSQILNNTFSETDTGLRFEYSDEAQVAGNIFLEGGDGINVYDSHDLAIEENSFDHMDYGGIFLYESEDNEVQDNRMNDTQNGIFVQYSTSNLVSGNHITNASTGICLYETSGNTITGNNVSSSNEGIYLSSSQETISGNVLSDCYIGVEVTECEAAVVEDNVIARCGDGVLVVNSNAAEVRSNDITECGNGIRLDDYSVVTVSHNEIGACEVGVLVSNQENSYLLSNSITSCLEAGILLEYIDQATLYDNALQGCSVLLEGNENGFTSLDVAINNTVNGRPVYLYCHDALGEDTIPAEAGEVILWDVDTALISGMQFDNTTVAVQIGYSDHVTIESCRFDNMTYRGIWVTASSSVTISQNDFVGCEAGLYSGNNDYVLVDYNDFAGCALGALDVEGNQVLFTDNTATGCEEGLSIDRSYSAVVEDNTITNCAIGIMINERAEVTESIISNCTTAGIMVEGGDGASVHDNSISGSEVGIYLSESDDMQLYRNVLTSCKVGVKVVEDYDDMIYENDISGSSISAMLLSKCEEVSVYGNVIEDCQSGIRDERGYDSEIHDNEIEACLDGIVVQGSEGTYLDRNNVNASERYGISIIGSEYVRAEYNTISNSTSYGMWVNTSLYTTVDLNRFIDNNGAGEVYDPEHAQAFDDRYVYVDIFGPGIYLNYPEDGDTITYGYLYLEIWAQDDSGVNYCEYRLNDGEWIVLDRDGSYFWDDDYPSLEDGDYKLEVRGWDMLGFSASAFINFTAVEGYDMMAPSPSTVKAVGGPAVMAPIDDDDEDEGEDSFTQWSTDLGNYWSDRLLPDADRDSIVDITYSIAGGNGTDMRPLGQVIAIPADLSATEDPFSVTLEWSGYNYSLVGPIDGYYLTRNSTTGGNFTVELGSDAYYYVDSTVDPYRVYTYTLAAFRGAVVGGVTQIEVMTPDPFPPSIVIDGPASGSLTKNSTVEAWWTGEDLYSGMSNYDVRLNEGEWIAVGMYTTYNFTGLVQGENMLWVRAVAVAGNTNETSVTVVLDSTVPSVSVDAPIDGAAFPASSVEAAWSGSDQESGIASYQYRVDGGEWYEMGSVLNATLTGLSDGEHTLEVMAVDNAGNNATASASFTVDTVGPFVSIVSPSNGTAVNSKTVRWEGQDATSGLDHYEYSLDGGNWTYVASATEHEFEGLSDGGHTVAIKMVDVAGLTGWANVTFTLDTVAPVVSITSPSNGAVGLSNMVAWEGSDARSGLAYYEYSLDGGDWVSAANTTGHTFNGLGQGQHTVLVRAYDQAGNDATATVTFTYDTVAPVVSITSPENGTWVNSGIVRWEGNDATSGLAYFEYSLDGGEWTNVSTATEHEFENLALGEHTVIVRMVDAVGLNSTATVVFSVDNIVPHVSVLLPEEGSRINAEDAQAVWSGFDLGSGIANYSVRFDGGEWTVMDLAESYSLMDLTDGEHRMEVRVLDQVGNHMVAEVNFTLDVSMPTVTDNGPTGSDAAVDSLIYVTFSEEMDPDTVSITVNGVQGTLTHDGNTFILEPTAHLAYNTEYRVSVSGKDLFGNMAETEWTFRTTNIGTLTGHIVDANGDPVVGAVVKLENGQSTITDEAGMFTFQTEAGEHTVTVSKDGYQATFSSATLAAGETTTLSAITLAPQASSAFDWWPVLLVVGATGCILMLLFVARRKK